MKDGISPTVVIEERNFHNAWARAVQAVLRKGADVVIGGSEQRKPIKDACILVSLTGNAIKQIEAKEIHPQYPFKRIKEYSQEFTREFLDEYRKKKLKEEQFSYLYFERFVFTPVAFIDQLDWMKNALTDTIERGITSNRIQITTWHPFYDWTEYPPCLQRIQVRYIPESYVDIHLDWRSRDLYNAWQSNVIDIIDMLKREVLEPNACRIAKIVDFNDSLHIYKTDIGQAREVKILPVSPQDISGR